MLSVFITFFHALCWWFGIVLSFDSPFFREVPVQVPGWFRVGSEWFLEVPVWLLRGFQCGFRDGSPIARVFTGPLIGPLLGPLLARFPTTFAVGDTAWASFHGFWAIDLYIFDKTTCRTFG